MTKKILVIGSLNMDQVTQVVKTPRVGETVMGKGMLLNPGGKGANQAVAMGKLGASVRMIGRVGNDANGLALKDNLIAMGVVDEVSVVEGTATGTAWIMVNADADNSIVVVEGANGELGPDQVDDAWFSDCDVVVTQLEVPYETVKKTIMRAKDLGKMTVLNPAPARDLEADLLGCIDLLVVNETEFELLSGIHYTEQADLVTGYSKLGVGALLLTLGSDGAYYIDENRVLFEPARRVNAVDTTAAGDSFIGGLMVMLAKGESMERSLAFATEVAAFTVMRLGAQSALPYLTDLSEDLR